MLFQKRLGSIHQAANSAQGIQEIAATAGFVHQLGECICQSGRSGRVIQA
ncbi:MAG: hypothetical protein ACJARI_003660 [Bacteroidia bacterium]|jgi:hypothetical protein